MKSIFIAIPLCLISLTAFCQTSASKLTYLSCDIPATEKEEARHFDFTLDEANSTVSFYVKEANAANVEKAIFSANSVTWTNKTRFSTLTRTISREDLSFTENFEIDENTKRTATGTCKIVTPKTRKF